MIKRVILFIVLFSFFACSKGWNQERKNQLYAECKESQEKIVKQPSPEEDVCLCAINEFASKISWSEYQRLLKTDLTKQEESYFNNKIQIILSKIEQECNVPFFSK